MLCVLCVLCALVVGPVLYELADGGLVLYVNNSSCGAAWGTGSKPAPVSMYAPPPF